MAKANKKAREIRKFDLVINGRVLWTKHGDVKFTQDKRKERRRMDQHLINLRKFPRSKCNYCKAEDEAKPMQPKHLPFTGGE